MKIVEMLKMGASMLKMMSENDVLRDDYRWVGMYEEFQQMRRCGLKYREAVRMLAEDYGTSQSTVERAMRRLDREVAEEPRHTERRRSGAGHGKDGAARRKERHSAKGHGMLKGGKV